MAEILLYGIIGDTFDKLDAKTVVPLIRAASGPLAVHINSPGGYVMDGLAIVEALRSYPGKVTVYIDGLAASMASVIAMVGSETIMAEASLMMIHKPWDASVGNADELRKDAAKLDRIEQQLIGIYAKRTGLPDDRLADMLAAETWLTADEALALGFATSISASLQLAAMADVSTCGFRHTPDRLKGTPMNAITTPAPTPSPDATQNAIAMERTRIATVMNLCTRHGLDAAFQQSLINSERSIDQCRATILDKLAEQSDTLNIGHFAPGYSGSHVTLDNPTTYGAAMQAALVAKIGGTAAEGPAAEFRSMSVVDMARDFLARNGARDVHRIQPDRVITMAMSRDNPFRNTAQNVVITQTTSDFPDLIGGAAETYLIDRYRRQESPLKLVARKRNRPDFQMAAGVQTGGFGTLDQVNEAGEFKNKTIATRKEQWKLATYGNMFNVSRQMLVNDHLGALADILTVMAGAAAEVEATILAALINSPPAMADGKAVFHADHGNLASTGAAPSITTLDAARLAMRRQKDLDGVGLIDANPKYLLVPVGLQTAAETLVSNAVSPTTAAEVNPFAGKLEPIAEPRLSNPTAWFLFADPAFSPSLEYGYLDGNETPFTDSQEGWRVDGTEYKVRHDFGGGWMEHRMAWKNPGA